MNQETKQQLINIFNAGIKAVEGYQATQHALSEDPDFQASQIIALGKAASGMCAGALASMSNPCPALIVTKYEHTERALYNLPDVTIIESAHPIPDQNSLRAGAAMLETVSQLQSNSHLLVLISGGASSLSELLPADISLSQWQKNTSKMIASDSNIAEINTQRKKFSLLKDGKLLAPFKGKRVKVLAISDVEGDDIAVIGSGTGDIKRVRSRAQLDIIATNAIARQACQKMAQNIGFRIQMNIENLYQDVSQVANDIAQAIITGKPGVYIFGGEPTINLPANPGSGGRNQSLALELAQRIRNLDNLNVLVAGTDGTDGPTDAAGGIIDGYTAQNTLRAQAALDAANAGGFLRDIGEIFITGPTNTNVMDLVIVLKT